MPDATDAAPPISPTAMRAVRWSLALVSANLLLLAISPIAGPWASLTGAAATVTLIVTLVLMRGAAGLRGLRWVLGTGIAVSVFTLFYGIGMLLFQEPLTNLSQCQDRALTHSAQQACMDAYEQDYTELLDRWGISLP